MSRHRPGGRVPAVLAAALLAGLLAVVLLSPADGDGEPEIDGAVPPVAGPDEDEPRAADRRRMVDRQLRDRGIDDPRVLVAMAEVPRHRFVPATLQGRAYADEPLPIGHRQTISQPYVVALMCELLAVGPDDRVLEIGTGSGYHAAVLSRLVDRVYSIEILEPLAERARETLDRLGYDNVRIRVGDGYRGWPDAAPFDAILLTAAPPRIPEPLLDQLAVGGRLVAPVGEGYQDLVRITRDEDGFHTESIAAVRFVPMRGEAEGTGP